MFMYTAREDGAHSKVCYGQCLPPPTPQTPTPPWVLKLVCWLRLLFAFLFILLLISLGILTLSLAVLCALKETHGCWHSYGGTDGLQWSLSHGGNFPTPIPSLSICNLKLTHPPLPPPSSPPPSLCILLHHICDISSSISPSICLISHPLVPTGHRKLKEQCRWKLPCLFCANGCVMLWLECTCMQRAVLTW